MSSRFSSSWRREPVDVVFWGVVGVLLFTLPGLPFLLDSWASWLAYVLGFYAGGVAVLALFKIAQTASPLEAVRRKLNIGGISK